MISLREFMSASSPQVPPNADEDGLSAFILGIADYCGFQPDGNGGGFDLFTLRKSLRGHPAGSTVTRKTLEAAYRAGYAAIAGKYCSVKVNPADPALGAVEGPQ